MIRLISTEIIVTNTKVPKIRKDLTNGSTATITFSKTQCTLTVF